MNKSKKLKRCLSLVVCLALVLTMVLIVNPFQEITAVAEQTEEVPTIQVQDFEGTAPELTKADDGTGTAKVATIENDAINASSVLEIKNDTGNLAVKVSGLSLKANTSYEVYLRYKFVPTGSNTDTWFYILGDSNNYAQYDSSINTWQLLAKTVTVSSELSYLQINLNRSGYLYIDDIKIVEGSLSYYYCDFEKSSDFGAPSSVTTSLYTEGAYSGTSLKMTPSANAVVKFPIMLKAGKTYNVSFVAKTPVWNYYLNDSSIGIAYDNWTQVTKEYTPTSDRLFQVNLYAADRVFDIDNIVIQEKMTASAISADSNMGSAVVSNAAPYYNDTVTYTATPVAGYKFTGWFDADDKFVSGNASYVHTVAEDNVLTAKFAAINPNVETQDFQGGYTLGGLNTNGVVKAGEGYSNTETDDALYIPVSSKGALNIYGFDFDANTKYNVTFNYKPMVTTQEYAWFAVYYTNSGYETAQSNSVYTGAADCGNWKSFNKNITFSEDMDCLRINLNSGEGVYIDNIVVRKAVSATVANDGNGQATVSDTFYGGNAVYTAIPATDYKFAGWKDSTGEIKYTNNPLTLTNVTEDPALTATFKAIVYNEDQDFDGEAPEYTMVNCIATDGSITIDEKVGVDGSKALHIKRDVDTANVGVDISGFKFEVGKAYKISFDYKRSEEGDGTWFYMFGDTKYYANAQTDWNTYETVFVPSETVNYLQISTNSCNDLYIDNIKVEVSDYIQGDVDFNGVVNEQDGIKLKKYLLGVDTTGFVTMLNVNRDSDIDILDLVSLDAILNPTE